MPRWISVSVFVQLYPPRNGRYAPSGIRGTETQERLRLMSRTPHETGSDVARPCSSPFAVDHGVRGRRPALSLLCKGRHQAYGGGHGRPIWNDSFQRDWTGVLINTSTGLIGRNDGSAERWAVIQEGSPDGDFVASPDRNLVSGSTQVLRIQTWAEKHRVTFLYFGLSMFVTGVCDEVR